MFAQVSRYVGRPNFQAGHAGSIPVIRSQLKALCRYRYLMSVTFPIIRGDVLVRPGEPGGLYVCELPVSLPDSSAS